MSNKPILPNSITTPAAYQTILRNNLEDAQAMLADVIREAETLTPLEIQTRIAAAALRISDCVSSLTTFRGMTAELRNQTAGPDVEPDQS